MTLLEKIISARESHSPLHKLSKELFEEGQVLVAWIQGEVDTDEACRALGITTKSQIHQKAGTSLRNLAKHRYISIQWHEPISDLAENKSK